MLEVIGLKLAGLARPVVKLFCVVRNVDGTGPPFGIDCDNAPKIICGALMFSSALPTRLKNE